MQQKTKKKKLNESRFIEAAAKQNTEVAKNRAFYFFLYE
jgi:hypothetical protein